MKTWEQKKDFLLDSVLEAQKIQVLATKECVSYWWEILMQMAQKVSLVLLILYHFTPKLMVIIDPEEKQNAEWKAFFSAQINSLCVTTGREAIELLLDSERVHIGILVQALIAYK